MIAATINKGDNAVKIKVFRLSPIKFKLIYKFNKHHF